MAWTGAAVDRVDGRLKVTGTAPYAGDTRVAGMAHAVLVLSTVPCGRISAIECLDASRMPGVLAVMTHLNAAKLPEAGRAGVDPPTGRVLNLLQDDVVHYNRQPVAVVVADTLDQAIAAAARIQVSYRQDRAQLSFADARSSAHAPAKAQTEAADSARGSFTGATPPSASAAAIEATYTTPMEHHNPLEPHATVAHWQGDELTLYDSTQSISGCQSTVAKTLGIPAENVRVVCPYVGGGFGTKGSVWSHVPLTAMAARQVGRPVKLVVERPQMFGPVGGRPQTEQRLAASADRSGRFVSMQHDVVSHTSMMEDFTEAAALQTRILYRCPNLRTTHRLVQLHAATPTFQRAPGHATGTFALESAIDELAVELGMDPVEMRLRNEPALDPEKRIPWSSRSLHQCYAEGAEAFGWSSRQPAPGSMRRGRELVGWGVATATYPANRSPAHAVARLTAEGTVVIQSGSQDLGTGTYTVMTQIAADALGLPMDRVRCELGDSRFPEAPISGGSQTVASLAPAVQSAALALREKLRGEPVAAALERNGGREIIAESSAAPGDEKHQYSLHSFGAVFIEVRVDPDLCIIRVPRVVARYSIGRLLNAKTGRSQLLGGVVWGIGMALMEESVLDERYGRIVNANLAEYHVPVNADIGLIDVDVVTENDSFVNPLGARGVGEIGITGVAAALANAVYHATGTRVRSLPITLDKLLV
ncbi:MAG: Xanthine dehydrogenase, molybdenum binding subunit [Gammaproteobacteria bacterium]|nr:Xanthine dehydrogenase, molybdenum binding subunit [Gammaproteobacteria bacterium]